VLGCVCCVCECVSVHASAFTHVCMCVHLRLRVHVYKCRNTRLSGIRSVRYRNEKISNNAGTYPVLDKADAFRHFFGPVLD
jgi:hypothetical protein